MDTIENEGQPITLDRIAYEYECIILMPEIEQL